MKKFTYNHLKNEELEQLKHFKLSISFANLQFSQSLISVLISFFKIIILTSNDNASMEPFKFSFGSLPIRIPLIFLIFLNSCLKSSKYPSS